MPVQRKTFRIEEIHPDGFPAGDPADEATLRHAEIMAELTALRTLFGARQPVPTVDRDAALHGAARRTAQELALLRSTEFAAMTRAAHELDAILSGSEQATQRILQAAEDIEQTANTLSATLKSDHEREMAEDIQDRATQLFEACNFQDLAGQRIANVAATLTRMQAHIETLMRIWNGIALPDLPEKASPPERGSDLLHGPQLADEAGHYSQDEIDVLFGGKPQVMSAA